MVRIYIFVFTLLVLCSSFRECISKGTEASDRRAIAFALEDIATK